VEACVGIHQLEIDSGTFERIFQFPLSLDGDGAHSNYQSGILEIVLPKRRREQAVVQISLRNE
jgi:HSP20 family molecular chaperone IbpA